jgi:hypothetical protein
VKTLLKTVKHAAQELKQDLAAYHNASGEDRP